jgi:hypothetical protein
VTFAAGDTVTLNAVTYANTLTQVVVGSGGLLNATGTTINESLANGGTALLTVNSHGQMTATFSSFAVTTVTLNAGAAGTVQFDTVSCQVVINSGAGFTFNQNDLTNVPGSNNGIVAVGDPTATIDLTNNYWGTTNPAQIAAKIKDHVTDSTRPTIKYQPFLAGEPTQTTAQSANTPYNASAQNVTLTATVMSPAGFINQGTVTFTVLDGSTTIGSPATGNVSSGGIATVSYGLPAGTARKAYTIQAVFNGTALYLTSSDSSHTLTVGAASTTTAASNVSVSYSRAAQNAQLTATVNSPGGTVSEGTETFTVLNGTTTIGNPVTVNVNQGAAAASYPLPAGLVGASYSIQAVYNGTVNFLTSSDSSHSLTVTGAATTTAAAYASVAYSASNQPVALSATVTSSVGTVDEGTETFTILKGSTVIGSSITVNVSAGAAAGTYTLPGGTTPGTYTIQAVYNGTNNFLSSTDTSHILTVSNGASTTTNAANATATYSTASQPVSLSATVTSSAGTVSEGTMTFTILKNNTTVGSPVTVGVSNGASSATYTLPGGTAPGTYTIQAVYSGSNNFLTSGDASHVLTVNGAPAPTVSVILDPASDSGASNHDGITNITTLVFDVQVNEAGTIKIDFDGNSAHDQTLVVSAAGTYSFTSPTLTDATYTATATFDAGLAGTAKGTTTYTINTHGAHVTLMIPTGTVNNRLAQATITFNELVDLSTFIPAAITLTGPAGTIPVNQPQFVSGTTYSISFAAQAVEGGYSLTIAPSVRDIAGNKMDQNQNGVNGESGDSFTGSFTIALPDLAVMAPSAPPRAVDGTSILVGWTVKNVSAANPAPGPWTDAVYLSTKSVLDGTAVRLTSLAAPTPPPLAPAGSYTRSNVSVTIPNDFTTGNDYLLFVADDNGGQAETDAGNDTNDLLAVPIVLAAPDLQVASVSGPSHGFVGQTVLLSWTDQNKGAAPATGPWVDNVYTAADAQGNNPTLLGSFTFTGTLAVGASVQRTQQVILPQTAGTRWFMVTTNATRTVAEGQNYNNNTTVSSASVSIFAVPLPDLVVTSITPPPSGSLSGHTVPLSFIVKNQGQAPTSVPVWQDWVILSQDATLGQTYQGQLNATGPGGDQTLNNQPVVVGSQNPSYLRPGDSYQQTVNVSLPISAQGTWYVYVVPDGTGAHHPFAMPETSRTDKLAISAAFTINLSTPPDLTVPSVQAPAQDFSGKPMNISWKVENDGAGPTAATAWVDAVYMSTLATLDDSAILLGKFPHQGAVAAGGSYPVNNQTVTLPVGVHGSYYFLVQTDVYGQVFENGATGNNVGATATAETVNLTPPPDLTVTLVQAPATAQAGHSLTVTYHVNNAGAGPTPNYTWNDTVYLSPTTTYDPSTAIFFAQGTYQGGLAAGKGYDNTVAGTLPNTLKGPYYVLVDTDSGNVVFELNKSNNWGASTGTTQVASAPADLSVTTGSAPAQTLAGSAVLVTWTVTNHGGGDTAVTAWVDNVYASASATFDASAVLLGSFPHYGLLKPGDSYSVTKLVNLPINLLGKYYLFIVTNATNTVYQPNQDNTSNPVQSTMTWQLNGRQAPVSDLQAASVKGPAAAQTGGNVTISWTEQNNGPGTTNATTWDDAVWISTTPTLGGTSVLVGSVQHTNPLPATKSYSASGTFTLPRTLAAGNYYFIVVADGSNVVYETDKTNNAAATSTATAVTAGPVADLAVSNVSAPATVTAGGTLPVSWTVTNNGADTGNVPIVDAVYLSFDQVFDPTDLYLGSVTTTGGLAAGKSYTQSSNLPLRAGVAGTYYVFVVTNSGNTVFELNTGDDANFGPQSVQINMPAPADLVAGTVTIPGSAVAGLTITVSYKVTNNGSVAANGSWTDALYLSPTPVWSVSDPLLGKVSQTRNLAAGDSYTGTLTATLPGVAPGSYYVILRSNILNTFPEPTLDNNLSASLTQTAIDAPALTLGTPTSGTLITGQAVYYRVVVGVGQTLQFVLSGQSGAFNELYVSYGTMPTRAQYDFRFSQTFAANQQITVPDTQAGTYYVLVYGANVPAGPENYTITASLVPFSVQAVTPGQAGTGPVTLQISGAQFGFGTVFQLRKGSVVLNATRILLGNAASAFATFDLTGQAQRSYDVWAIQPDNTSTQLASALQVVAALTNSVQLQLIPPDGVLVGRPGIITVSYRNTGNTDLPAPLLLLNGQNALFQAPGGTDFSRSSLQLLAYNPTGPFGTLPPGFQGSITLSYMPVTIGAGVTSTFTLQTLQDPNQPFDWNAVAVKDVPTSTSPQQWASFVSKAASLLGSTWGAVVSALDNDSVQLLKDASRASATAGNGLYSFDALLQYAVGVYGSTPPAGSAPSFQVVGSEGEVTVYNAHVDGSGNPLPLNPSWPTYVLVPGWGGYRNDFGNLTGAIASATACFPNGHVNVLIATWQGATSGPTLLGIHVPWIAALHIDIAGDQLGDVLGSLVQHSQIAFGTTTGIGEDFGNYVLNEAAIRVGGLENLIALNPANALGGYLPPDLALNFQHSTAYETSSFLDTQTALAASNYALATGDLNDPIALHIFGVSWLTGQVLGNNCILLDPAYNGGPDNLPLGNAPPAPSDPQGQLIATAVVVQIASHDPNNIIGPQGTGTNQYITDDQSLPYEITFTNQPGANGPAQRVTITDQLDANLDWRTFRLGSFGFDGMIFSVPADTAYYQVRIDLTQTKGYYVDVTATIDESTGIATWVFETVSPATGQEPLDPNIGFLAVDDANGAGEGFVTYTVRAKAGDATGTIIYGQATITFDTQPPLATPQIFNTVDASTGLTSSVDPLPPLFTTLTFLVTWSGTDGANGSGIKYYTIYVSDNGGAFVPWLTGTTQTAADFVGVDGHTYGFFSIATDNAGNQQPFPSGAQATTTIQAGPTTFQITAPSGATAGAAFSITVTALDIYNNPATLYTGTVHFTTSDTGSGVQLPADYTFTAADKGVHTFTNGVTLVTAGNQKVTVTDTATSTLTGSATVSVTAAAASHFTVGAPSSATAGTAFNFTVTALDPFNNTATAYAGTVHFTSSDGQASLPADSTLTNGTGSFSATLKTAGNQTLTATDTASSSITGTSNAVTVSAGALNHFLLGVPATATTGTAFPFTVTAVDAFNNPTNSYSGTLHFSSSDSTANLPGNSTLTNGSGTFNATLNKSGNQTLTATDIANGALNGTSSVIIVRGLVVTSFTATPTGFSVTFSKPFVNSSANPVSPINLYDAASASYGPADVTLVGSGSIGSVKGSLIIDPSNTRFTFIKTGGPIGGGSTGLLAAGTYTVTIVSGSTAFKDAAGQGLDGNNDGVNGDNYVTTFTVTTPTGVVVTVPDFARGPDSSDAINVPNNAVGNGIPVALSNGVGVTDATFVLQYNANLLNITGGTVNPALTGATFTVTTSGSGAAAQATIVFHSPTALASGAVRLGGLTATVPSNAPYKSKELLHWNSLSLNGGTIPTVADDGVHAVVFLGDVSGDGSYSSADSVLLSRLASAADSGLAAFPVLDPLLVGDINGDGRITATDGALLNNYLAGSPVLQIPPYPGPPSNNPSGPDPALSVPTHLQGNPGGTVTVPVNIEDPHPAGSTGLTQAQLALTYDPTVFTVSAADVHLGTVPAAGSGWTLQTTVDTTTGQIAITLFSVTPISSPVGGSLVTIDFHVKPTAASGTTSIDLATSVNPNGHGLVQTALADDQGLLTLDVTLAEDDTGSGSAGRVVVTVESTGATPQAEPVAAVAQSDLPPLVPISDSPVGTEPGPSRLDNNLSVVSESPPPANLLDVARALAHSTEHDIQFVTNAYAEYLQRTPDAAGLTAWVSGMQAGTYSDEQVEALFLSSPEYLAHHGGIGSTWIRSLYHDVLGRTPSAAEVEGWLDGLNAGTSPAAVALAFTTSLERAQQRVRADYATYLGRAPRQDEVDLWANGLRGGLSNEDLVAGFIGSPEYYLNQQKGRDNAAAWVAQAYHDVLFRAAGAGEINLWLDLLDS